MMSSTHSTVFKAMLLALVALFLGACTCRDQDASEPSAPSTTVARTHSDSDTAQPELMTARMRVVDLAGNPLRGMRPIATRQPNAFDEPIATGTPTDATGESRIQFSAADKVALRAWDRDLLYFPNNFYEVLPGSGVIRDTLVVSMVESASIEAVLFTVDGAPLANENTGIMLFHPIHGPWWPAEANTDESGAITFYRVPPGNFVFRIRTASGIMIEVPETHIAPGKSTHLGALYLQ